MIIKTLILVLNLIEVVLHRLSKDKKCKKIKENLGLSTKYKRYKRS